MMSNPAPTPFRGPAPGTRFRAAVAALWRDMLGAWRYALARPHRRSHDAAALRDLAIGPADEAYFRADADRLGVRTRPLAAQPRTWR